MYSSLSRVGRRRKQRHETSGIGAYGQQHGTSQRLVDNVRQHLRQTYHTSVAQQRANRHGCALRQGGEHALQEASGVWRCHIRQHMHNGEGVVLCDTHRQHRLHELNAERWLFLESDCCCIQQRRHVTIAQGGEKRLCTTSSRTNCL